MVRQPIRQLQLAGKGEPNLKEENRWRWMRWWKAKTIGREKNQWMKKHIQFIYENILLIIAECWIHIFLGLGQEKSFWEDLEVLLPVVLVDFVYLSWGLNWYSSCCIHSAAVRFCWLSREAGPWVQSSKISLYCAGSYTLHLSLIVLG